MDNATNFSRDIDAAASEPESDVPVRAERRSAPRQKLLIRVAKLISAQGEFACVVRDVSECGVSIRLFHALPWCKQLELEMPTGKRYAIELVRYEGDQAAFKFPDSIDLAEFERESGEYPKRPLRLGVFFPVRLSSLEHSSEAIVENLSRQGAQLTCDAHFAIDQNVRIEGFADAEVLGEVRAKVRWRNDTHYGVVFDDTLTLEQFARLAAQLQTPALLDDDSAV